MPCVETFLDTKTALSVHEPCNAIVGDRIATQNVDHNSTLAAISIPLTIALFMDFM